jgi:hypothetical protein
VEKLRDSLTTVGWRQAIKMLFTVHTPDLIGSVKCPVAMLAGSLDKIAPYEFHTQHLMASAPSAELHLFDGYGHMLKLEAPSRFNEIIRTMAVNAASPRADDALTMSDEKLKAKEKAKEGIVQDKSPADLPTFTQWRIVSILCRVKPLAEGRLCGRSSACGRAVAVLGQPPPRSSA